MEPLLLAGGAEGIASFTLQPDGRLIPAHRLALPGSSAWIAPHHSGRHLFTTLNSPPPVAGGSDAVPVTDVAAVELEPGSGAVRLINRQPCGRTPCHCAVHDTGRWLLSANFLGGEVVVHPIRSDGSLGPASQRQSQLAAAGLPPDDEPTLAAGDGRSAAHHVALSPRGGHLALVSDLRLDSVIGYRFDAAEGRLLAAGRVERSVAPPYAHQPLPRRPDPGVPPPALGTRAAGTWSSGRQATSRTASTRAGSATRRPA